MLKRLKGRSHEVVTGTALMDATTGICSTSAKASRIYMRDYADEEIDAYIESGETFRQGGWPTPSRDDKFQDLPSVSRGCYLNTVGLPLCDLLTLLKRIGAPVTFRKGYVIPPGCPDCDYWKSHHRWSSRGEPTMSFLGMGTMEIFIILLVAFIFLGPERMVDAARTLGKWTGELRAYGFRPCKQRWTIW